MSVGSVVVRHAPAAAVVVRSSFFVEDELGRRTVYQGLDVETYLFV